MPFTLKNAAPVTTEKEYYIRVRSGLLPYSYRPYRAHKRMPPRQPLKRSIASGCVRDFHPIVTAHTGRTKECRPGNPWKGVLRQEAWPAHAKNAVPLTRDGM